MVTVPLLPFTVVVTVALFTVVTLPTVLTSIVPEIP